MSSSQCLAKTMTGHRCRNRVSNFGLCHVHYRISSEYINHKQVMKPNQHGGGFAGPGVDFLRQYGIPLLPSCLDILKCDWITDITYALPGFSSLLKLIRL